MAEERFYEEWPEGEYDNPVRHPWLGEVHLTAIRERGYAMPDETAPLVDEVRRLRSTTVASPAPADLASAITWARTIHKGRAALLLADAAERLTRIVARLRARADEEQAWAAKASGAGSVAHTARAFVLRSEADALEGGEQ